MTLETREGIDYLVLTVTKHGKARTYAFASGVTLAEVTAKAEELGDAIPSDNSDS